MKRTKYLIMVGVLSVCSCFGLFSQSVYADSNTMTVSPPYRKLILIPGETYSGSVSVFNSSNSTRSLKYEVEVGSFSQKKAEGENAKDDYGAMDHVSKSSYNQIMDWIKLSKTSGTLAPGVSEDIPYTIDVPKDAPGGGQYATILVIDKTTSGGGVGNIGIDQSFQFASIIYAEVTGETRQNGEILENSISSFLLTGNLTAESMVKNDGNVHTDAEYTLQVWPMFSDEEICTNEENPETSLILPETERYHAQTCELPAVGLFRAKQTVKIFGETSVVEKTIVVCPLWLLFLIVFVLVVLVLWIVMRVRSSKRGRRNQSED